MSPDVDYGDKKQPASRIIQTINHCCAIHTLKCFCALEKSFRLIYVNAHFSSCETVPLRNRDLLRVFSRSSSLIFSCHLSKDSNCDVWLGKVDKLVAKRSTVIWVWRLQAVPTYLAEDKKWIRRVTLGIFVGISRILDLNKASNFQLNFAKSPLCYRS